MSATSSDQMEAKSKCFQRLPTCIVPQHYSITLQPNLTTFVFHGEEIVKLNVKEETNKIILNAADLEILRASFLSSENGEQEAKSVLVDPADGILTLLFDPPIKPTNNGSLHLEFNGTLNDSLKGFYRSKYTTDDGEVRYNACTQFESSDARRCFPCWDEPAIRATFDMTLVVPKNKVAISNMPEKSIRKHGTDCDLHIVEFATTPSMSTYLIAVVVGDFDYVEDRTPDGIQCRVYTPPGKKEQGRFALDVTVRVLPYYSEYFGIAYKLPKLDLIAIKDFAIGAMENWGAIVYRETCLLVDESNSSAINKQYVALVVGHEIAHMWFGNLVALEWWTHLWLKEGYASWIEFLCVDHLFPEYDIWTQFVTDIFARAQQLDSLDSSHPIEIKVGHPSEIDEIFDTISYNKGASIIRMLHNYVGSNDFKKGMNIYLTRHQYGNASTEDLWTALEESSGKPIGAVMSTWTQQMGFPLITVEASRQEGNNRILKLTQQKYSTNPLQNTNTNKNFKWLIPLTFSSSQNPKSVLHQVLMDTKTMQVTIPLEEGQWVKLNTDSVGYYRVSYSKEMLQQFIPAIKDRSLPPLDRLNIVDDIFALVQSGQISTVQVLQMLEAFKDEDDYTVWTCISTILRRLNHLLAYTEGECHNRFKLYCQRILERIVDKVGWNQIGNDSHMDTLLQSLVLEDMVTFDHDMTIKEGKMRFAAHLKGEKVIPADLRSTVYKAILSEPIGKELDLIFESMIKLYRESELMEEQERIAHGLSTLRDPLLLQKGLEFAISEDVRNQDSVFVIIDLARTKCGRELAWIFFKERVDFFKKRYIGGSMVSRLIKNVAERFVTSEKGREIEKFFLDNPYPGTERAVGQAVESILVNEAWLKRDQVQIEVYLNSLAL